MTHSKRLAISWDEIENDAKALADRLAAIGSWHRILAIPRGGLIPAALIAHHLKIRRVDSLQTIDTDQQGNDHTEDEIGLLIVDELVDTGSTIQAIKRHYPTAHVATLYAKPAGRPMADSFIREFPQNIWLEFPWERD